MANEDNTLFVKHLPAVLSQDERTELLRHFGAEHVRCMSDHGKMKYSAFATFSDFETASFALKRLHQLEILGSKLCVEFSKSGHNDFFPSVLGQPKTEEKSPADGVEKSGTGNSVKKTEGPLLPESVNSVNSKLEVNYPLNPKLKYMYPPPTVSILTNIANALATVPKFYVQVLHLMNKMNLPSPFGVITPTPPIATELPSAPAPNLGADVLMEEEMVMSSTEESELESDSDGVKDKMILPVKRPKKQHVPKKPKLQKLAATPKLISGASALKPHDVFEPVDNQGSKRIEFKLQSGISKAFDHTNPEGFSDMSEFERTFEIQETSGFGKIEPQNKTGLDEQTDERTESDTELSTYVSSSELRRYRLSEREMKDYSVFKDYSPGETSSRLYIKNLHRRTTQKELKYVFGRFVDWSNELEVNMFDVRLMTEGRMKGQAFVTLASEEFASKALKQTNGYLLHKRPMVVSFARCAKAKEVAEMAAEEDSCSQDVVKTSDFSGKRDSKVQNRSIGNAVPTRTESISIRQPDSNSLNRSKDPKSNSRETRSSIGKEQTLPQVLPLRSDIENESLETVTRDAAKKVNCGDDDFNNSVREIPGSTESSKSVDLNATPPLLGAESPEIESEQFITKEMLRQNRLATSEIQTHKLFKNYSRGDPSCKLYVKNLDHKSVTEEDLLYIFGRFVKSGNAEGLDIRLLQGRMKGQAFVTYPSVEEAQSALEQVNWYKLYDKPMVIQFGKS